MADTILVLDFGSQYNQLIARRIREKGVYSLLKSHEMTAAEIRAIPGLKGIVFSGGPKSVYAEDAYSCDPEIAGSMLENVMTLCRLKGTPEMSGWEQLAEAVGKAVGQ